MQTGAAIVWDTFNNYNGPNYAVIFKQGIYDQFSLTSIPTPDIRLPIQKAINEAILSICITIITITIFKDFFFLNFSLINLN